MVSNGAATPLAVLRQALRGEIGATSLRQVAGQVPISPLLLQRFVDGSAPRGSTRRGVERWYVLHGPGRLRRGVDAPTALAVLRVLVQDLAPARHPAALELLVKSLEDAYRTAGLPRPDWLGDVRAGVAAGR
jgi:hypothetical protein